MGGRRNIGVDEERLGLRHSGFLLFGQDDDGSLASCCMRDKLSILLPSLVLKVVFPLSVLISNRNGMDTANRCSIVRHM